MKLHDVQILKLLYTMADRPYKASSHWTVTPYKNNPLFEIPKAEFKRDPLFEYPKKKS